MRATVLTYGSLGDVQPYVALGAGLRCAGHHVRIATHSAFAPLVTQHGLEFYPIPGDPTHVLESRSGLSWLQAGGNSLLFARGLARIARSLMDQVAVASWDACRGADALITSVLGFYGGRQVAEKLNLPLVLASYTPAAPTTAFPNPLLCPPWLRGAFANRITHELAMQLLWQPLRPSLNKLRRDVFSLPPLSIGGLAAEIRNGRWPTLCGYSPAVVPRPPDWGEDAHVTGYWFLDQATRWKAPPELLSFLSRGKKPVYIGFGSMWIQDARAASDLALAALRITGNRGVLQTGPGALSSADLPPDVIGIDWAPHDWLFPQMAAVVHHGGAGTTAAAVRAGVPSVVTPFFADQPFWGRQLSALGIAPPPIPYRSLNVKRLVNAIRIATCDNKMIDRAKQLGERVRAERGVEKAVQLVERYTSNLPAGGSVSK
jgi:sterol 3beta-glucosyltransferase